MKLSILKRKKNLDLIKSNIRIDISNNNINKNTQVLKGCFKIKNSSEVLERK
jgi:hypothetical protein